MIIAIDGNEANVKQKVGVSIYTYRLLQYFQKKANKNLQFVVYLKNKPLVDLPWENKYFKYEIIPGRFLWSQIFLPFALYRDRLLKNKIDVFFSPAHYVPRFCPIPLVVTIHDLSYFSYPQDFLKKDLYQLKNWTKYSVEKTKKIIAVSKTTKKDIMQYYQIQDNKVKVIYNGYEKKNQKSKACSERSRRVKSQNYNSKLKSDKPFILYVGTLQPRKNIITLIRAFAQLKKNHPEFELIIAGKKGWLYEKIYQEVEKLNVDNVIFTDYITDNQLASLYQTAFCLVLPSFYEGFGIPILEAMGYDCPVISSFSSSLPEIGDDACLYFDPNNHNDLLEKILLLKDNNQLRNELVKKGKERVKLFSWEKCAKQTLKLITNQAYSTASVE